MTFEVVLVVLGCWGGCVKKVTASKFIGSSPVPDSTSRKYRLVKGVDSDNEKKLLYLSCPNATFRL